MKDITGSTDEASVELAQGIRAAYKRDFWVQENRKHVPAHHRLRKVARVANHIAQSSECDLLDVGCGPGTLGRLLKTNISYYGVDIALHEHAPNLIERDLATAPIDFDGRKFQIVVAQGFFEYIGRLQSTKFEEIARLLDADGRFVVSYTNFGHRRSHIFEAFSNVQPMTIFRESLDCHFNVLRVFPTAYNWYGGQPRGKIVSGVNMYLNVNLPLITPQLAVEYMFICSPRQAGSEAITAAC